MKRLGLDKVWTDEAGNVVGCVAGGEGPSLMLNGHIDHVDAGDPARWAYPPFGGEIHDGAIWGRGVADMKGAVAAMVYAGGLIKSLGLQPAGDLCISAVVQEEVGGLGARYVTQQLPLDRAIIGEASKNHLRRGHRGRIELVTSFEGRSVHASMPDLGVNPHFSMARFLDQLPALEMAADPIYGASSVAPTCVHSEPSSANVTPEKVELVLDWRNIPIEEPPEILSKLRALLVQSSRPDCRGTIEIATKDLTSYTGFQMTYPDTFPSFTTAPDDPWLCAAQRALSSALNRDINVGIWRFATDGGHFAASGTTVIGLGPGDDRLVHTVEERLPIDELVESLVAYTTLALGDGPLSPNDSQHGPVTMQATDQG
jgi:putative selenium metabolism hydrolase